MIEWGAVAAFTGPLIGAIGLVAGWFAWLGKQREKRTGEQINAVTNELRSNQALMQQRIGQMEVALVSQGQHLDRQDTALASALQATARIEGRLMGSPPPGASGM